MKVIDLRFWHKKERFLLLEVLPEKTTALFLSVNQDKHITIESVRDHVGPKEMAAYLRVHRAKSNIIVAAASSLVVTSTLPVHIDRFNKDVPLSAIELENVLSKAIGQAFNQCRSDASRELGVDDLDAILVNSQVIHFKIDGHRVLNPVGFRVRTIEAVLELTLTTRDVFVRLNALLTSHKSFFFTESGRSMLANLAKVRQMPITFVDLGAERSTYYVLQKAAVGTRLERANLVWHSTKYREIIAEEFAVNHQAARDLYALCLACGLSESATKHFEKLLKPGTQSLLAELKLAKFKGEILLTCDDVLPVQLPYKYGNFVLAEPPVMELLETLGVTANLSAWGRTPGQALVRLAPLLEFYFAKNNSQVNEWLKRHLNWLGASV